MTQQYLNYNASTGEITDSNGMYIFNFAGAVPVDIASENKTTSVDDMIKLKNSGFTAEEVIAIKKANL